MRNKHNYNIVPYNKGTRMMVFKDMSNVTNFSEVPKHIIYKLANFYKLYLYGEVCQHTGKHLYKVGKLNNENEGVINLYTTVSKAKYNKFIIEYAGN